MTTLSPIENAAPSNEPRLAAVVLAAGMGKRMRSALPKVLHPIAGVPLVGHVLRAVAPLNPTPTVLVIGHGGAQVRETLGPGLTYATQDQQLGTGHAVLQARSAVEGQAPTVLVLYGDTPLLRPATLQDLVALHGRSPGTHITMLTCIAPDPTGYGRIIRQPGGQIEGIIEERVASESVRAINEINSGIYCFDSAWLWPRLAALPVHPGVGEYFLTDLVGVAIAEDPESVQAWTVTGMEEAAGINTRVQLAEAEAMLRDRIRRYWMLEGVTMVDPATTYIDADVTLGQDTVLHPGCYLRGSTQVAANCQIGPFARLVDATVGDGCTVGSSLLEGCTLEPGVDVGSFNHLRPGAYLSRGVHIGNFAEVKNSRLGQNVAMGHFSYLGDADLGDGTNVGAGTITANWDGVRKNRTSIGAGVFLGVDTLLRAPVELGNGAATGAGAVVTKNVAPGTLVVGMPARPIRRSAPKDPSPVVGAPEEQVAPDRDASG